MFSLPIVQLFQVSVRGRATLSTAFVLFAAIGAFSFVRRNHVERSVLRLTGTGWARQLRIGTLWTLPVLIACTALKWYHVRSAGGTLFGGSAIIDRYAAPGASSWLILTAATLTLSIALEFIRCAIHGSLQFFFRTSHIVAEWAAIAVASIVCAALQIHFGAMFAWLNFALGRFWGALFAKERSFLATAVSHAAIVVWTVCLLGLPP